MLLFIQMFLVVLILGLSSAYQNQYDGELLFECPSSNQIVSKVASTHSNNAEDRVFDLACRDIDIASVALSAPSCSWPSKNIRTLK